MNRGNRREPIFHDDADRRRCLETLGEACAKTGWQVHAYVLMPNHFHLVVETPQPNLVADMKWFLGNYTGRFNRRHKLCGHLFSGRYKALLVEATGAVYLKAVCDDVHLNPERAKLLAPEQPLRRFAWSSWPAYVGAPSRRPAWLRVDRVLGEHGLAKDSPAGRRELEQRVEAQRAAEAPGAYREIRRGWCLGAETFRQELLGRMTERLGAEHYGAERAETQAEKAARVIAEELQRLGWTERTLQDRPKGDAAKKKMAQRLRAETMQTVAWMAARLHLGSRNYANHLLWKANPSKQRVVNNKNFSGCTGAIPH